MAEPAGAADVHALIHGVNDLTRVILAHFEVLTLQLVDIKHTLNNISAHLTHTEAQMALDAKTMQDQLAAATDTLAANFTALTATLAAAIAASAASSDAAVQDALSGFQPQIDALTQMGVDENNPVPPVVAVDPNA
jgi:hypothetical protein